MSVGQQCWALNPDGKLFARRDDPGRKCAVEVTLPSQPWIFKGGEKRLIYKACAVPWCPQPCCTGPVTPVMQGTG